MNTYDFVPNTFTIIFIFFFIHFASIVIIIFPLLASVLTLLLHTYLQLSFEWIHFYDGKKSVNIIIIKF